jgi:hypothetical protein
VVEAPGFVDDVAVDEVPVDVVFEEDVPAVVVPVDAALAVVSVVVVVLDEPPHAARPSAVATRIALSAISDGRGVNLRRGVLWWDMKLLCRSYGFRALRSCGSEHIDRST